MLDVNGIYVGYNDSPILKEVSLHIEEGTVLALIGPNGSGKTTFIRAVSGILPLMKGSITIDGIDLNRLNSNQRARKISVVPQARSIPAAFTAE